MLAHWRFPEEMFSAIQPVLVAKAFRLQRPRYYDKYFNNLSFCSSTIKFLRSPPRRPPSELVSRLAKAAGGEKSRGSSNGRHKN